MTAQEENTRGSSQKAAPTRPLHDCACCFVAGLKSALNHMPFPVGPFVVTVDRWTHPLTQSLEHHGLSILAAVDDKVLAMGSLAEGYIFCPATQVKRVLWLLHKQGILGTTACVWLKYEGIAKEGIRKAVDVANRIPLVNYATPAVCAVVSPLAMAVSDWLLKHARQLLERSGDRETVNICNLVIAKHEAEMEKPNTAEMEVPRGDDATWAIDAVVGDAHSGVGEDVDVDDFIKHDDKRDATEDDFVEHPSGKDVSIDDAVAAETSSVLDSTTKDELQLADTSLADANVEGGARAAEKPLERPRLASPEEARSLPDVLEMIESSWLHGHSPSSPPRTSHTSKASPPPRTSHTSKARSDGLSKSFKTFFSR